MLLHSRSILSYSSFVDFKVLRRYLSQVNMELIGKKKYNNFDYKEAIYTLNTLQSNAQYIKNAKTTNSKQQNNMTEMKKFLERSGITLAELDELSVIHVTGTNGKGSSCAYCESILRSHGYKTGFYSSPHLLDVRERIRINGSPISKDVFAQYFWQIFNVLDKLKAQDYDMPLYFRFLTIMAFHIFRNFNVDVAIFEVGIGGEYDCTNIIRKTAVVGITPLDIDHTSLLGNSLEEIAWNKAGIMKPGSVVFTAPQPDGVLKVLQKRSIERQCKLNILQEYDFAMNNVSIPGHIHKENAGMGLALAEAFINLDKNNNTTFSMDLAKKAIDICHWPGRYEIIHRNNVRYFLDGAHTLDSVKICSDWFISKVDEHTTRVLIFNVTGERNAESLLRILIKCHFDIAIFAPNIGCKSDPIDTVDNILTVNKQLERCQLHKDIWKKLNEKLHHTETFTTVQNAVEYLESSPNRVDVLITGSIHLIGAAMNVLDPTLNGTL